MKNESPKCPHCGSDYLEQKPLRFSDAVIALISNDHIAHFLCLSCLKECRAFLPKRKHMRQQTSADGSHSSGERV